MIAGILIVSILIILNNSLSETNTFSNIANSINKNFIIQKSNLNKVKASSDVSSIIYFTFFKYCLTKLMVYTILIYAIILSVKNYNAQMHNHIINIHKSNALKSTLNLLNTARSDDGNDKLLIQATQAIFTHQNTGYNGNDSEPPSPNLITNVIDAASKKL